MDKVVSNKNNIDNIKASKENFAKLLEESLSKEIKKVGGLVKGTVVAIEKDTVLIDIGFKSEGRVPIKEFTPPDKRPELGDEVEVFLSMLKTNSVMLSYLEKEQKGKRLGK